MISEVDRHRESDDRAREHKPERDGDRDGDVRDKLNRREDDAGDHLVDRSQDGSQRLRRVAPEPQQLRRARVADQETRDQVGLRRVCSPDRQPQTEHREQAARDEESRGDQEQDQRGSITVGSPLSPSASMSEPATR